MKRLFFCLMILSFVVRAIAQTTATNVQPTTVNARWDLDKYLWSHSNYKTGKTDKPALDYDAIDNWQGVGPDNVLTISNDGKYCTYGISKGTINAQLQTVTVKSTTGIWQQDIGKSSGFFSADSKQYIFQEKDELCFLQLGTDHIRRIKDVLFFTQPLKSKGEWLAYQIKTGGSVILLNLLTGKEKRLNDISGYMFDNSGTWLTYKKNTGELIAYNPTTEKELSFPPVTTYQFNSNGRSLVLQTSDKTANGVINALHYVNLPDGEKKTIWTSSDTSLSIGGYLPHDNGGQVLFTIQEKKSGIEENSIWYWKEGMDKAEMKVNNQTKGIDSDVMIALNPNLLPSGAIFAGKNLLFVLQPRPVKLSKVKDPINMDVWSYKDTILYSAQVFSSQNDEGNSKFSLAVVNPDNGKVIRVDQEDETYRIFPNGDYTIVGKVTDEVHGDRFWEYGKENNWLLSLKDGSRKLLPFKSKITRNWTPNFWLSPGGNYLVYFDGEKQCNYFSYDLRTDRIVNISAGVPAYMLGEKNSLIHTTEKPNESFGIAAWLDGDKGLLVYDDFDIWQLDPTGQKPAINITGGYGRANKTMFSLMNNRRRFGNIDVIRDRDTLLLSAFNPETKYNGFYRKIFGTTGNPELLYMGACYFQTLTSDAIDPGMQPIKAAGSNEWIVKKQTATEAPNYFVTTDFKSYKALTNIQPHKSYNWLTTELINFKLIDGTNSQGVLYKPENFDPSKKYPVIISFYLHVSDRPYQYPTPSFLQSPLLIDNPAWLVSHGYLVFLPDMHIKKGQWGPSTVNTVDGAARYLKTLSYVDGKRLGAAGHSNSGRFGFYLLSHSTSFAAMCVGEATTNIISAGLGIGLLGDGNSMLEWVEQSSTGTGLGSLWKNKATWLDHSAVLNADKVTSPLLLFDNKDGLMRDQAAQLFTSLRRLDKKAWWVHYDRGGHKMAFQPYIKDFTLRYTQFFDHYLKGAPAPRWMTQGIPYKYRGVETRYELDPGGECGSNCTVCKKNKPKP